MVRDENEHERALEGLAIVINNVKSVAAKALHGVLLELMEASPQIAALAEIARTALKNGGTRRHKKTPKKYRKKSHRKHTRRQRRQHTRRQRRQNMRVQRRQHTRRQRRQHTRFRRKQTSLYKRR